MKEVVGEGVDQNRRRERFLRLLAQHYSLVFPATHIETVTNLSTETWLV